jgi:hypothetical protein
MSVDDVISVILPAVEEINIDHPIIKSSLEEQQRPIFSHVKANMSRSPWAQPGIAPTARSKEIHQSNSTF